MPLEFFQSKELFNISVLSKLWLERIAKNSPIAVVSQIWTEAPTHTRMSKRQANIW